MDHRVWKLTVQILSLGIVCCRPKESRGLSGQIQAQRSLVPTLHPLMKAFGQRTRKDPEVSEPHDVHGQLCTSFWSIQGEKTRHGLLH